MTYLTPEINIIRFNCDDILMTSTNDVVTPGNFEAPGFNF